MHIDSGLNYVYHHVTLNRVVDADTLDLELDLGFHLHSTQRFRVLGINAPEIRGEERPYGLIAHNRVKTLFHDYPIDRIWTKKTDGFGRWLANIFIIAPGIFPPHKSILLSDILIKEGLAAPWDGKGLIPRPWLSEGYPILPGSKSRQLSLDLSNE